MNTFVNAVTNEATTTTTENGALTYTTSLDACVDLFFQIAAIRGKGAGRVEPIFRRAYAQNPDLATKIALWVRDIRGGAGERQTFRDVMKILEKTDVDRLIRILPLVPVVGRFDDLFIFDNPKVKDAAFAVWGHALMNGDTAGLAAKWAPRETGAKKAVARELMKAYELTPKRYRVLITTLSNTVEQKMSANLWDEIEFSHVPSVAASRYSKAFRKHQPIRYDEFIQKAMSGEAKINASALFPHDVTMRTGDAETANALWKALPDYVPEGMSFMPVIDCSGSMWLPEAKVSKNVYAGDIAIGLGIYLAERNKSAFKNLAMTFASTPSYIKVPVTDSISDKVYSVRRAANGYSTDLNATFRLILKTAVENSVKQEDMPDYLLILSDMEFNVAGSNTTNFEEAKRQFAAAGYKTPKLIWWNIASRNGVVPVRAGDKGTAMVSGYSPAIVKSLLTGEIDPVSIMLKTVDVERYSH